MKTFTSAVKDQVVVDPLHIPVLMDGKEVEHFWIEDMPDNLFVLTFQQVAFREVLVAVEVYISFQLHPCRQSMPNLLRLKGELR